jgi:hypothetical protein
LQNGSGFINMKKRLPGRPKAMEVDPDAKTSQMLKKTLLDLLTASPIRRCSQPAMQLFLRTATGKGIWPWLAADGKVNSFTFSERETAGANVILRYKAVLGNITRWFSFTVTADEKIAQIYWWQESICFAQ